MRDFWQSIADIVNRATLIDTYFILSGKQDMGELSDAERDAHAFGDGVSRYHQGKVQGRGVERAMKEKPHGKQVW